ncbi:cilia- and flagella-associated protein 251-like [Tupaia chinensis]|uniref:cilia- and flagella-associated protein 251-like n=1 Tax=Tupaia chinensis TaxID=246437 RepID=UPI0003C8DF18|nr:cilia- and flagella-associated protein 251-like [Tupaia chinensis]
MSAREEQKVASVEEDKSNDTAEQAPVPNVLPVESAEGSDGIHGIAAYVASQAVMQALWELESWQEAPWPMVEEDSYVLLEEEEEQKEAEDKEEQKEAEDEVNKEKEEKEKEEEFYQEEWGRDYNEEEDYKQEVDQEITEVPEDPATDYKYEISDFETSR